MSTKTYSISEDFGGTTPLFEDLEAAIVADAAITTAVSHISGDSENITIYFSTALSASEETALDDLVANYEQDVNISVYETIGTQNAKTDSDVYEILFTHIFPGTLSHGTPKKIKIITQKEGSHIAGYDVRIFDYTNTATIAEITGLTNESLDFIDIGTIANLSEAGAVWEFQMRANYDSVSDKNKNSDFAFLRGIQIGY